MQGVSQTFYTDGPSEEEQKRIKQWEQSLDRVFSGEKGAWCIEIPAENAPQWKKEMKTRFERIRESFDWKVNESPTLRILTQDHDSWAESPSYRESKLLLEISRLSEEDLKSLVDPGRDLDSLPPDCSSAMKSYMFSMTPWMRTAFGQGERMFARLNEYPSARFKSPSDSSQQDFGIAHLADGGPTEYKKVNTFFSKPVSKPKESVPFVFGEKHSKFDFLFKEGECVSLAQLNLILSNGNFPKVRYDNRLRWQYVFLKGHFTAKDLTNIVLKTAVSPPAYIQSSLYKTGMEAVESILDRLKGITDRVALKGLNGVQLQEFRGGTRSAGELAKASDFFRDYMKKHPELDSNTRINLSTRLGLRIVGESTGVGNNANCSLGFNREN